MHRRSLLMGTGPVLAGLQSNPAQAIRGPAPRQLQLRHAATGARFTGTYHNGLMVDPVALAELSQVLADSRTGTVHAYDPAVIDILWETGQKAGLRGEFLVVSGFRTPQTNAAVCGAGNSQHLRAGALDVCLVANQLGRFSDAALALRRGGVGLYAQQSFVHIDSGPVRRWGTGPGSGGPAAAPPAEDRIGRMAQAWAAARLP